MCAAKSTNLSRRVGWPFRAGVFLSLTLAACQSPGPTETTQPRLPLDASATATSRSPTKPASATSPDVTYTVKRGTLRDSVTVTGRVQPALSAQVAVPSSGTISSVYVHTGQAVAKGDPIVDLSVDETTLQAAR